MTKKVRNLQNCKIKESSPCFSFKRQVWENIKETASHYIGKRKVKQLPTATVDSTDTEICKNPAIFCTI